MDDAPRSLLIMPQAELYRCPGESYPIERAVHLGRLASYYPACRECVHRHETHTLAPQEVAHWAEVEQRGPRQPRWTAESLSASAHNVIEADTVRQFATALAIVLWRQERAGVKHPGVLVGADGHWSTAELVAAACEALELAGCRAVEVGAVTSAALAAGTARLQADAAVWLGNASGLPHALDLQVWGRGGVPWSAPGGLDLVREFQRAQTPRPKRRGGRLERAQVDEAYLAPLASLFHALRPLRFVVDTTCQPLGRYLDRLAEDAACQVVRPSESCGMVKGEDEARPFQARRLALVARQVVSLDAHFGLWIDGSGEACLVVDERGKAVAPEAFLMLLARHVCQARSGPLVVLERESSHAMEAALVGLGAGSMRSNSTRQAMSAAISTGGAVLGGGPSGRVWFSGEPAAADALLGLSLLLSVLSESDRPLSEVLDGR